MSNEIAVIMATFKRPERLQRTIEMLNEQTFQDFYFYVWNNNLEIKDAVDSVLEESGRDYGVYHSKENTGPWGRPMAGKKLAKDYPFAIFIDDDQVFGKYYIEDLASEAKEKTVTGGYAWKFKPGKTYWNRTKLAPGQPADYIGGAGVIHDTTLFKQKKLFDYNDLAFGCDDLWVSYYASHVLVCDLISSKTKVNLVVDGKDMSLNIKDEKVKLLDYLRKEKGWKV